MKKLIIILFLSIGICMIHAQSIDTLKYISLKPVDFSQEMKWVENSLIIDVREPFEYRKSRIPGAINIAGRANLEVAADTLSKYNHYFLYCTSGFRSKNSAAFLAGKGFTRLYSLDGGIVEWRKSGYPVERRKARIK